MKLSILVSGLSVVIVLTLPDGQCLFKMILHIFMYLFSLFPMLGGKNLFPLALLLRESEG